MSQAKEDGFIDRKELRKEETKEQVGSVIKVTSFMK